jgi:hypothetical protein
VWQLGPHDEHDQHDECQRIDERVSHGIDDDEQHDADDDHDDAPPPTRPQAHAAGDCGRR